jgi:hypothetical protein
MKRISIVLAFAATACGGAKPLPVISPTSDVSGHWLLNEQQSDNAADKIAAAMPGRDRSSGDGASEGGSGMGRRRWGGGGRGGRGGMRGGGGGMDPQEIARRRARAELTIDLARDVSEDLDVRVTPGAVRLITHGTLDTLDLKTDGGKEKTKMWQGDEELQVTSRATWSDGWLVVTRDVDGGGKITETYLRAPEGQRLYVVVQLEMPRFGRGGDDGPSHAIEIRRVYDPATGS